MKIDFFHNEFETSEGVFILDKSDGHVSNFGKQWRDYVDVQIDSKNNFDISKKYLEDLLFNNLEVLEDKNVLEVGSGAGRFTEHICKYAKQCVSVDLSSAIYFNVASDEENLIRVKADFLKLEPKERFDVVICRGVLQHTPDPKISILKLHEFLSEDAGSVFFDVYPMPKIGKLHPKYCLWRPLFKTFISYERCDSFLKRNIKPLLKVKRNLKKIMFNSDFLSDGLIPVWDYYGKLKLNEEQLEIWAVLDTLDGLYAKYDFPMSNRSVISLIDKHGIYLQETDKIRNFFKTSFSKQTGL